MKILFEARSIIPGKSGGIENYLYMLVNAWKTEFKDDEISLHIPPGTEQKYIDKVGVDVNLLVDPVYKRTQKLGDRSRIIKLITTLLVKTIPRFESALFGLRKEWIRQMDEKVDVVIYPFQREKYVHDSSKVIFVMHDFREWDSNIGNRSIMDEQIKAINESSAIVVSWPYPKKRLLELFPKSRLKLFEIPFLYDPFVSNKLNTADHIGDFLYYPSANAVHKNHENLIIGLSMYNLLNPNKQLRLICTGPIDPKRKVVLDSLIDKHHAKQFIQFLGFVSREKVFDLYRNCFAVATSSKYEAFSGAILEAYKFKKPVIASSIAPNVEFLKKYGLELNLFDPNNPENIQNALQELTNNYSKYSVLSIQGFNVLKYITPEYTVTKFREIAQNLSLKN